MLLSASLIACSATAATADVTCVGASAVVCTNDGVTGTIGDPPSGPVTGSTSLKVINTSSGEASTIEIKTGKSGDGVIVNDGVVAGRMSVNVGIFFDGASPVGSATAINNGTVGGPILARTDYAADVAIYNHGTAGVLRGETNGGPLGAVTIVNTGRSNAILTYANGAFSKALVENSGVTGFIRTSATTEARTVNSGSTGLIETDGQSLASVRNEGVVNRYVSSTSSLGSASVFNSGTIEGDATATSDRASASLTNSGMIGGRASISSKSGATSVENSGSIDGGLSVSGLSSTIDLKTGGRVRNIGDGANGIEISGQSTVTLAGEAGGGAGGLAIRFDQQTATDDRLELRDGFALAGAVDAGGGHDALALGAGRWSFGAINLNGEDFDDDNNPVAPTVPTFLNFEEISGTSAATGTINVRSGDVALTGTLAGADIVVGLGARLGGTGTVHDLTVRSFGALDPGASGAIGALTATGTARFEAYSNLLVDVAADGSSDQVKAGRALIEGGSVVGFAASSLSGYVDGTRSVIVSTENGVTGRFEDVYSQLAFIDFALDYTPTEVALVTHVKALETAAVTGDQRAAARGLQGFATSADAEARAFYDTLLGAPSAEAARAVFDDVSGEANASILAGLVQSNLAFTRGVRDRAAAPASDQPSAPLVWAALIGERWTSGRGGAAKADQTLGGVIGGIDLLRLESPGFGSFTGGVSFGYSHGDFGVGARGASAKTDSAHAGLYATLDNGPVLVNAAASYGYHSVDASRRIAFLAGQATADYDAHSFGFSGEARYRFAAGALTVAPLVSFDAVRVSAQGARETGAGVLDLDIGRASYAAGAVGVGTAFGYQWTAAGLGQIKADARVAYEFGFGRDPRRRQAFAAGAAFTVRGADPTADRLALGVGLSVEPAKDLAVGLRYDGGFGRDTTSHRGQITASYRF